MLLKKKSHLISIWAASPISSPYYSNLSDGREHSREKSNIPRPSTFNISSQDGRRAGRRADWEIKQEDFQRETRWLCSTPAAIIQRDGNLTETVWCVLVLSSLAKYCKISTCWKTAKKIMESERMGFLCFYNRPLGVHLGGMTCIRLQEIIENDKDCTLLKASAEVHFLHSAMSLYLQRKTLI